MKKTITETLVYLILVNTTGLPIETPTLKKCDIKTPYLEEGCLDGNE